MEHPFDTLSRTLGAQRSRRAMLRQLGVAMVSAAAGTIMPRWARADSPCPDGCPDCKTCTIGGCVGCAAVGLCCHYGDCEDGCPPCWSCQEGACVNTCDACQTCSQEGGCVDTCTICQFCGGDFQCFNKCNRPCQTCDSAGNCVSTCDTCSTCQGLHCVSPCGPCEDCAQGVGCIPTLKCRTCEVCQPDGNCVSCGNAGLCCDSGSCVAVTACPDGGCCTNGACGCPDGQTCNGGVCCSGAGGPCKTDADCCGGFNCNTITGMCGPVTGSGSSPPPPSSPPPCPPISGLPGTVTAGLRYSFPVTGLDANAPVTVTIDGQVVTTMNTNPMTDGGGSVRDVAGNAEMHLPIPAGLAPGTHQLKVTTGGKSACATITVS